LIGVCEHIEITAAMKILQMRRNYSKTSLFRTSRDRR